MKTARYFKDAEFRKCTPSCSIEDMEQDFLDVMDDVRRRAGIPLLLSSAYRSSEWDRKKGRSGDGAHTYGIGCDFVCNSPATRRKILKACLECGITRIGVSSSFIHIDIAGGGRVFNSHVTPGKAVKFTDNIIWTY